MSFVTVPEYHSEYTREGYYWPLVFSIAALGMIGCVLVHRHLYADGSFFLIRILETGRFTDFDTSRFYAHLIMQGPVWVAINWLHIRDFRALSWIYGFTLYMHPVLSLWGCWLILKRRNRSLMILPALSWACLALLTSFFIISESWVGVSLFWPVYFLLLYRRHRLRIFESVLLVAMCIVCIRVYEAFFVPAALLAYLAIRRVLWWQKLHKVDLAAVLALLVLIAATAADMYWSLFPRDAGNRISLLAGIPVFFRFKASYVVLFAMVVFTRFTHFSRRVVALLCAAFLIAAFTWALVPWIEVLAIKPNRHADVRIINNFLPFALGLLPFIATKISFFRPAFDRVRRVTFAWFVFAVVLWQFSANVAWFDYLKDFSSVLDSRRGLVELQNTNLSRYGFDWPWTMPSMSVALSAIDDKPVKTMILNRPNVGWEPFDPKLPESYPKLGRYGVKYEVYAR